MSLVAKTPFNFHTRQNLTYLSARKARNIPELLKGIREASPASIYHHTHHFLQRHEFLSPEPPNDFAYWITNVYQDNVLGETVASIDIRQFYRIEDIRKRIVEILEDALRQGVVERNVPPGMEFNFMKAQTFVLRTQHEANNLWEFRDALQKVTIFSIYYHAFESRLRLEQDQNDFSVWLANSLNEEKLAREFAKVDPYTQTLEGLRRRLIGLVSRRLEEKSNA